jgi:glycosyltransferase involved in cell wall biosynthesis
MINSKPLISVIVPTYNRDFLLQRAVKSVIHQSYNNLEIIIVDDASIDNTEKIIRKLRNEDNRVRYIKIKTNQGAATARNIGIKKSNGDFIAFQDSDDIWIHDKLEKQMNFFEKNPSIKMVYTRVVSFGKKTIKLVPSNRKKNTAGKLFSELLKSNFIDLPSVMIRKEILIKYPFDPKLQRLQEWDMWLRISPSINIGYINEVLLISNFSENSISNNSDLIPKSVDIIKKRLKAKHQNYKLRFFYFNISRLYLFNQKWLEGLIAVINCCVAYLEFLKKKLLTNL